MIKSKLLKIVNTIKTSQKARKFAAIIPLIVITGILCAVMPTRSEEQLVPVYATPLQEMTQPEETTELPSEEATTTPEPMSTSVSEEKKASYKIKQNVSAQKATGNAAVDEDAAPVKDVSANETKVPAAAPDVSMSVKTPDSAEFYSSPMTSLVYAAKNTLNGWYDINSSQYYFDDSHNYLTGSQTLANVKYRFNENGSKSSLTGIDVSKWNGKINWTAVKNAGVDYVIIRVGFRGYGSAGALKIDSSFDENMNGAISAGLQVGLYFYSQAITVDEALEEATVAVDNARRYKISYPIYFDTEFSTDAKSGRADKLTKSQRTECAVAFCEAVRHAGYTPGVYASRDFFYDNLYFSDISAYQIWVAHYTGGDTNFKHKHQMWQYTSKASIDGISGHVDLNICYYDYKNKTDMTGKGKDTIFVETKEDFAPFVTAENAISAYKNSNSLTDYNAAEKQIANLSDSTVKSKLLKALGEAPATTETVSDLQSNNSAILTQGV